jgi:O-antigen/teichoic acid export membrane protein
MNSKILATAIGRSRTRHGGCILAPRMRSAGLAARAAARDSTHELTEAENPFRNAKLRHVRLVAYKSLADAAGKASLFVITIVAAHQLTPWAFGVFALGTTIGWLLAVATDFGMQMHLARAVASDLPGAAATLRRWWRRRLAAAAAGMAAFLLFLAFAGTGRPLAVPLAIFALLYLLTSLVEFINYFYRGLSRTDIESTLTLWQRGAALLLGVAALYWRPDVTVLALALLLPAVGSLGWSLRHASRMQQSRAPTTMDDFFADVFPIGVGIVLSAVYFRVDVLLVQLWVGTEAVGGYNAVFRLVDAMRLFPAALLAVALPWLCRARDYRPLRDVAATVTIGAAAAAVVVWAEADSIVTLLFGSGYRPAGPVLRILVIAFPLLSLNLALTHQLIGWNRQRSFAAICGAALVANLALNLWLIPGYALEGAAWATVGTELCVTTGCLAALRGGAA